jgi:serine/threonine-protein kinase HipA
VRPCWICLDAIADGGAYHAPCLQRLFGQDFAPRIADDRDALQRAGVEMVSLGRGSISGVQPKVLVKLSPDGMRLLVVGRGGRFILKPQTASFEALPENEHVTMRLAEVRGIEVPACGLIGLGDGSRAYIVRRFDRGEGEPPPKYRQEDLCALAELPSEKKYDGSAELCVRLVRKYASDPAAEVRRLYRQFVFAFWTGNGDLHLKNLSLTTHGDRTRLTPAYDLVSTRVVIPEDDGMALAVNGKRHRLQRSDWLKFARYCGISEEEADVTISSVVTGLDEAIELIARSLLPAAHQRRYMDVLTAQAKVFGAAR